MTKSITELRKLRQDAKQAKNAAQKAVKELTDIETPKKLRKPRKAFAKRIRDFIAKQAKRFKALDKLIQKRKAAKKEKGPKKAIEWAKAQVGTTESPYGSNWGHPVQDWIMWLGYSSPVPWCGCFAGTAVIREGGANIPNKIRLGYTPYICQDATNNTNGLKKVSIYDVQKGDLVVYNFGSGEAKHVGVSTGPLIGSTVTTVEGNTSSDAGGSQDNGGTVAIRQRLITQVLCVARPDY